MNAPSRIQFTSGELALIARLLQAEVRIQEKCADAQRPMSLGWANAEEERRTAACALARVRAA